ncbi:MAG: HAMP domain-containing sensor histidine kinase [Acidobacteriota bacterium]
MEIVLSERNKTLAAYIIFFIILLLPLSFYLLTDDLPELNNISDGIVKQIGVYEEKIGKEINELKSRSVELYKRHRVSVLRHKEMQPGESVVIVKDGVIDSYFGEVFYFRYSGIAQEDWKLVKKEDFLYFIEKLEDNVFFIKKFRTSENIFEGLKDKFPFISEEVKFYESPSPEIESRVQYDENIRSFFIYHVSENSKRQLYLIVKFSTEDYIRYWKNTSKIKFLFIYLLLVLIFRAVLSKRFKFLRTAGLIIAASIIFLLIRLYANGSLYIDIFGFEIRSVLMFLYLSILVHILITRLIFKIKNGNVLSVLISSSMIISLILSVILIRSVNFSFMKFNTDLNYILFLLSLYTLLTIPFRLLDKKKVQRNTNHIFLFITLQVISVIITVILIKISYVIPMILSITLILNYLYKVNLLFETMRILAISAVIFLMVFSFSESEKKRFTSQGLKKIFANQNNYAKFISRELIHNIHQRNEDLAGYFREDSANELEKIWRRSIAFKENISSGIYVISAEKKILSSFSYRIPYLNVSTNEIYPLWMIDDFKTEYFGRTISVAVASINIFEKNEYLGKIIIQVINSSDLITSDHPESNIFTLNNRIEGDNISYIKLNNKMQIIENPSNIDIGNMSRKRGTEENWIKFDFMDTKFSGYMFENNEDTLIVFSPVTNLSEILSNIIKIFLLLIVVNGILNIRMLFRSDWGIIFRTFSIRVFAILILISLFSATIFSLFSLQFNKRNREIEFRRQIYNNGSVAYNIISDIIQQNKSLERDDLFYLSKILNSDITLYLENRLIDTSNYNRIIRSEIPVMINSNIPMLLDESERFYIDREEGSSKIFFNVGEYIVRLDFSGIARDILTRPELFSNFIINLFFILTVTGILLAFIFRKKILSPINILNNKMSKVEKGELEKISEIPSEIELRNLFDGFNSMVAGIYEQKKNVSDIARMKTLVKLSRWIAHEVKNPLTPIKLSAEQILMSLKDKRDDYEELITESVKYIIDETEHLRKISFGFLDISNLDKLDVSRFDIAELCRNEIFKLKQVFKSIQFEFNSKENIPEVELDKMKITQVLKNLLTNSIESIKSREGRINLSLDYKEKCVKIHLRDNGAGIEGPAFDRLFDEDFSTKSSGTGLGLFIVKRIIDLHKGTIDFESSSSGTIVDISLPVEKAAGDSKNG